MKPHEQTLGDGYAIRMGRSVPPDGANLAYIGNVLADIDIANVEILDAPIYIDSTQQEYTMYADEDYALYHTKHDYHIHTDNILVTDVFTQDTNQSPLYYKYRLSGHVLRNIEEPTIYTSEDIYVIKWNALMSTERYIVVLEPTDNEGIASVVIYTNFTGDRWNIYQAVYPKFDTGSREEDPHTRELLNPTPVFTRVDYIEPWPGDHEGERVYALQPQGQGGYRVFVGNSGSGAPIGARQAHNCYTNVVIEHDMLSSPDNPIVLNVGIISVENYPGGHIRDSLYNLTQFMPAHVTMRNPHPYLTQVGYRHLNTWINKAFEEDYDTEQYWVADINMPQYHMYDYDLIIIAGRGEIVFTATQSMHIQEYLNRGGIIWIDNQGADELSSLSLVNSPIACSFHEHESSPTCTVHYENYLDLLNRYYPIPTINAPIFNTHLIGVQYSHDNTHQLIYKHLGEDITQTYLMVAKYNNIGTCIISSCGVLEQTLAGNCGMIWLAINILIRAAEYGWTTTSHIASSVINHDALLAADYTTDNIALHYQIGHSNDPSVSIVSLRHVSRLTLYEQAKQYLTRLRPYHIINYYPNIYGQGVVISPDKEHYQNQDRLYIYTTQSSTPWEIPAHAELSIIYPQVNLRYTVKTFTHVRPPGETTYQTIPAEDMNYITHQLTLSAYNGLTNAHRHHTPMPLTAALPGGRSGPEWVDKSMVYYTVEAGHYNSQGEWQQGSRDSNVYIYDTATGQYIIAKDGTLTIAATDITDTMVVLADTNQYDVVSTHKFNLAIIPSRLSLEPPIYPYYTAPWYLRVHNGKITKEYPLLCDDPGRNVPGPANICRYQLPEFYNQAFDPHGQYTTMKRNLEVAEFVDNNVVRVSHTPMVVSEELPLRVVRRDYELTVVSGESLQTTNNFIFYAQHGNWMLQPPPIIYNHDPADYTINYEDGIITFDSPASEVIVDYTYARDIEIPVAGYNTNNGTIELEQPIDHTDNILVTYYYEQQYLTYKGYYDGEVFWHLDLNPTPGHYITYPGEAGPEDIETYKLLGESVYVYILPHITEHAIPLGNEPDSTTEYNTVRHVFDQGHWELIKQAEPCAMLLGKVKIRSATDTSQLVLLDTRSYGGGLRQTISRDEMDATASRNNLPSATEHYWDIGTWSGDAYQTQGVAIFTVPSSVKIENGGQFTEDEIIAIIRKQLATGVVPVLNYADTAVMNIDATAKVRGMERTALPSTVWVVHEEPQQTDTCIVALEDMGIVDYGDNMPQPEDEYVLHVIEISHIQVIE